MKPSEITLCMISRGEPGLARAIKSALPLVGGVVVVCDPADRGAVGDRCLQFVCVSDTPPVRIIERTWDGNFSKQRQASFDAATTPYALWLDSDDELVGAEKLAGVLESYPDLAGNEQFMLDYDYSSTVIQIRERLVPRALGKWADTSGDPLEIHELWLAQPSEPVLVPIGRQIAYVRHRVDEESAEERVVKRARNRKALEAHITRRLQTAAGPDRRLVSHYVDQLLADGDAQRAIRWAMKLSTDEQHGWPRHRVYMQAAAGHLMLGDLRTAHSTALLALGEQVRSAAARIALIELCARQERWDEAWYWYKDSYEQGLPLLGDPIGHDPRHMKPPYKLACQILCGMNAFDDALEYAQKAGDAELARKLFSESKNLKAAEAASDMMDQADFEACRPRFGDREARRAFCQSLPRAIQDYPQVARWLLPDVPPDRPTVAIFCGGEQGGMTNTWGPASLGQGIGGSEEAVLRIAPELARQGAHVEVYGPWPKDEIRDGVHYIYHAKWDSDRALDLFIAWRYESFAQMAPRCKKRVLWAHDQLPPDRMSFAKIDEVWCLSKSHASLTKQNHPAAPIWVTRNGLPPAINLEATGTERTEDCKVPGRVIWASSPDRGLDILLDLWPGVRAAVPGATLEVYYGFPASYMRAEQSRPELRVLREKIEGQLAALKDSGVSYYGMVGADRLHRAFAEAEVWAYPTHWPETSCITAMKAQALGCLPVTVPLTALGETVRWGVLLPLGGENMMAAWDETDRQVYLDALVKALQTPWAERNWDPALATAFGWDNVAAEWLAHLPQIGDSRGHFVGSDDGAGGGQRRGLRGLEPGLASGDGRSGAVGGSGAPAVGQCDRDGAPLAGQSPAPAVDCLTTS